MRQRKVNLSFTLMQALLMSLAKLSKGFIVVRAAKSKPVHRAESSLKEPSDSNFGRQQYWNEVYQKEAEYSWYSGWDDIGPFFQEFCPELSSSILIPGVGNDPMVVGMYDEGYQQITAFDYAEEGVRRTKALLGPSRSEAVVIVADARDLEMSTCSFDVVLEKGTLDAIYLSGGKDKALGKQHLHMAVQEFARVIKPSGVLISITAACVDAVTESLNDHLSEDGNWEQLCDGSLYTTEDGYVSNSIDGTMLVWRKTD